MIFQHHKESITTAAAMSGYAGLIPCPPHCNENPIYVFLFWELRDLSPNFHIDVSVNDLYIPRISSHISCSRIGRSIEGIQYIHRSQTHECGNWDCGRANHFLENLFRIFGVGSAEWTYSIWRCTTMQHFALGVRTTYVFPPPAV